MIFLIIFPIYYYYYYFIILLFIFLKIYIELSDKG